MKNIIKARIYKDGSRYKFKNGRVEIYRLDNDDFGVIFKALSKQLQPRAQHKVIRGKIVSTALKISKEAAVCLSEGLNNHLDCRLEKKRGNKEENIIDIAISQIYQHILDSRNPNATTKRGGDYRIGLNKAIDVLKDLKSIHFDNQGQREMYGEYKNNDDTKESQKYEHQDGEN